MQKSMVIGLSLGVLCCLAFTLPSLLIVPPEPIAYITLGPPGLMMGDVGADLRLDKDMIYIPPGLMMGDVGYIYQVEIRQWTGSWTYRGTISTSGGTVAVVAEQPILFTLQSQLDVGTGGKYTCGGADDIVRCYIVIDGEVSSTLMTIDICEEVESDFWFAFTYEWNAAGKPAAGVTYTCTFTYQAYY